MIFLLQVLKDYPKMRRRMSETAEKRLRSISMEKLGNITEDGSESDERYVSLQNPCLDLSFQGGRVGGINI